ncbi:MAG: putative sortase family protein [Candidatus Saccharibacteria bacterium]|nr:putative sortase family protein [Candidatus Saccharibacteria bacterium]
MQKHNFGLRQFNHLLTGIVILLAVYILVAPFLPRAALYAARATDKKHGYAYQNRVRPQPSSTAKPVPSDNRLVIPSLELNQPISESKSISVLNNGGTWRRPKTSTPDKGGNTVIIGHRYTYKGLSTFYNLDQLKYDDVIIIYWQGKEHDYRVRENKVVPPSTVSIEAPSDDPRLTLYTCTPLWNAKSRLVIVAEPVIITP